MIGVSFQTLLDWLAGILLSPASLLSIWSLGSALMIAVTVALIRRKGRDVPLPVLWRAMLPRSRLTSPSARVDIAFTIFSIVASSSLLGWAVVSHVLVSDAMADVLRQSLGPVSLALPAPLSVAATTIALWLAYEWAYYLNHWLSHKWAPLWAFHKVHHSAETLSPLTIFRVHPVDSIAFYNVLALATGLTSGAMRFLLSDSVQPLTIAGTNVLLIAAIMSVKHLQHSHVWIAFRGGWGRVILSPAHHQIHHSNAAEHHDRNFGATLALFDWMAGTLYIPDAKRQPLRFGVDDLAHPHSFKGAVITPFIDAAVSCSAQPVVEARAPTLDTARSALDVRTAAR